jgi:hypothetical protein
MVHSPYNAITFPRSEGGNNSKKGGAQHTPFFVNWLPAPRAGEGQGWGS